MKYLTKSSMRTYSAMGKFAALRILFGAALSLALASVPAVAQTPAETPSGALINPSAIEFSPLTGKIYAVNISASSVTIADDAANDTRQVKVGAEPVSLAVNTQTGTVYIANAGDGTVSVLDGHTNAVTATVQVGVHPYSVAVNSATGKVYVSHTFNDQLTILDAATNTTTQIKAGSADLIAIDEGKDRVYLLGYEGGNLKILSGAGFLIDEASIGMHTWGMALDAAANRLLVARIGSDELASLNLAAEHPSAGITMLPTGKLPCAVAINPRTDRIYVVNYGDNTLSVFAKSSGQALATIPVGVAPEAVAVNAATDQIFVANTHSNTVTIIDGKQNRVLATRSAGRHPYALAVNPVTNQLHIANLDAVSTTVLDLQSKVADR